MESMTHPLVRAGAVALLSMGVWTTGHSAAGRPMTIDDLITAVRVTEPALSPEGRTVLFVRTTTNGETGRRNADIWTVPADGSAPPQPFITGESSETTPVFSGDGTRIAFLSSRAGAPQVFVARRDGSDREAGDDARGGRAGAARVLEATGRGSRSCRTCSPSARTKPATRKRADEKREEPGQGAQDHASALSPLGRVARGHPSSHLRERGGVAARRATSRPATTIRRRIFYEDAAVSFSPDGSQLAFVSNREGNDVESWTTNQDVWIVPVAGGTARRLDAQQGGGRSAGVDARWPPDRHSRASGGRTSNPIAGISTSTTPPAASARTVFETPDLSVEDFALDTDGRTIVFTAQDRGVVNIYSVPSAGGHPRVVARGGAIAGLEVGARLRRLRQEHDDVAGRM